MKIMFILLFEILHRLPSVSSNDCKILNSLFITSSTNCSSKKKSTGDHFPGVSPIKNGHCSPSETDVTM